MSKIWRLKSHEYYYFMSRCYHSWATSIFEALSSKSKFWHANSFEQLGPQAELFCREGQIIPATVAQWNEVAIGHGGCCIELSYLLHARQKHSHVEQRAPTSLGERFEKNICTLTLCYYPPSPLWDVDSATPNNSYPWPPSKSINALWHKHLIAGATHNMKIRFPGMES